MKQAFQFVIIAFFCCSIASSATRIRVQVMVLGTDPLSKAAAKTLEQDFEAIPDVIAVGKDPDYLVAVLVSKSSPKTGNVVAIAAYSGEIPEASLAAAILNPQANPDDIHNLEVVLHSFARLASFDQQVGPEGDFEHLCGNIVADIDQRALAKERAHPRGGSDRQAVLLNFAARVGAKQVATGVSDRQNDLKNRAEAGDRVAQYNWGVTLARGIGVTQDPDAAVTWYQRAAEQGLKEAQANLAAAYATGTGVAQNYNEALRWYRKAADQGDASAQVNLGFLYYIGNGTPQDFDQAVRWFREAADRGQPAAMMALAGCYQLGEGLMRDFVQAYMWLTLAVSRTTGDEQKDYLSLREKLYAGMTRKQVEEAQRLAGAWKPKSAR